MLPALDARGNLPPGIHEANWETVVARFGTSPARRLLLVQLRAALDALAASGCRRAWLDLRRLAALAPALHPLRGSREERQRRFGGDYVAVAAPPEIGVPASFRRDREGRPKGRGLLHLTGGGAMIRNEREYRASLAHRRQRLAARAAHEAAPQADGEAQAVLLAGVAELAEYGGLRRGETTALEVADLAALPDARAHERIAAGLTQRALAARLGVSEEQVRKDEAGGTPGPHWHGSPGFWRRSGSPTARRSPSKSAARITADPRYTPSALCARHWARAAATMVAGSRTAVLLGQDRSAPSPGWPASAASPGTTSACRRHSGDCISSPSPSCCSHASSPSWPEVHNRL